MSTGERGAIVSIAACSGSRQTRAVSPSLPVALYFVTWLLETHQPMRQICIKFLEGKDGVADRLAIEVPLPASELREVWEALLSQGLGIRDAELVVAGSYLTVVLGLREPDGALLSPARRLEIQASLVGALAPVPRAHPLTRDIIASG